MLLSEAREQGAKLKGEQLGLKLEYILDAVNSSSGLKQHATTLAQFLALRPPKITKFITSRRNSGPHYIASLRV